MGDQNCIPPKRPTYDPSLGEQLTPAVIAELRMQLVIIKRDALGLVRTVEMAQGIPPEKSAIRNRAERRADAGRVETSGEDGG